MATTRKNTIVEKKIAHMNIDIKLIELSTMMKENRKNRSIINQKKVVKNQKGKINVKKLKKKIKNLRNKKNHIVKL